MFGRKKQSNIKSGFNAPLMTQEQVLEFMQRGMAQASSSSQIHSDTMQKRSGEKLSPFRGSGLDYEESRPYQYGDDLRNINWRLMARTNELYTKVFREERETTRIIVVDRRSAMRFGTRGDLKITRAVQIAAYLAGVSLKQGYSVGGVVIQPETIWIEPHRSNSKVHSWLYDVVEHCSVLDESPSNPPLNSLLAQLHLRLAPGSQVVLISDFHDLNKSDKAILSQLRSSHHLSTVKVQDPAEKSLPTSGVWAINAHDSDQFVTLHSDNSLQRSYAEEVNQKKEDLQALLKSVQIPLVNISTNEDFNDAVEKLAHV